MTTKQFIVAALMVLLAIVAYNGYKDSQRLNKIKMEAVEMVSDTNEDLYKNTYVNGCMDGKESNIDFCICTYDYMKDELGLKKFMREAVDYATSGNLSPVLSSVMDKAVTACQ